MAKSKKKSTKRSKPVTALKLKGRVVSPAILERSPVAAATHAISSMLKAMHHPAAANAEPTKALPLPQVFPCKIGDVLQVMYHVNSIVAVMDLFWAPDEDADGQPDELIQIGHSETSSVRGATPALTSGWSFLIWDFAPADQNPWTAQLSISVNGGPPFVFEEVSGNEGTHHQAGLLIWAAPHE